MKKKIIDNIKTLFYALLIALFIRSFFFQPFYIPSSSMEPNLLVGDRLFVSKYSYGYSQHSFPFSPKIFTGRILEKLPKRGDVVVFKTSYRNDDIFFIRMVCNLFNSCKTDFIKRLIGLPGDEIQFVNGDLFINGQEVTKKRTKKFKSFDTYMETLPNGVTYTAIYNNQNTSWTNSDLYTVPKNHYFFLGDNRDNSRDSRYISGPGYINKDDLVGNARIIFFSSDKKKGSFFKFWNWNEIVRKDRLFKKIK